MPEKKKSEFKRVLNTRDVLVVAFGAMIGWGWVINSGDWLITAGTLGAIVAFLIGGAMVICVGLTYAELTSAMPRCGGEHIFSFRALGATASFICTWSIVLGYVATAAYEAVALPTVITYLFPNFNQIYLYTIAGRDIYATTIILGCIMAIIITCINIASVKKAAFLQTILTVVIAMAGILLFVVSAFSGDGSNISGQLVEKGEGSIISSIFKVTCMTPFLFVGFDVIPQASEEINIPYRKIGKIMIFSILLAICWYLLVILAVSYIMPHEAIVNEFNTQTGLVSAKAMEMAFGSPVMGNVLIIGGFCGIITSWNSFLLGGSRAIYSMGESHMLPGIFGKLGKRKTPVFALMLCGICCFIAPFFGRGVLIWLVDAASFGCVIAYLIVSISFVVLRKKEPLMERPYKVKAGNAVGVTAIILSAFMSLLYIVPQSVFSYGAGLIWQEWIVVGAWVLLGLSLYIYSKYKYKDKFGGTDV